MLYVEKRKENEHNGDEKHMRKIPVELHEKLKLEVEELGISIPKYLEMVIEEHMTRKGEKTNMADLRTVAVQVTEDLFPD